MASGPLRTGRSSTEWPRVLVVRAPDRTVSIKQGGLQRGPGGGVSYPPWREANDMGPQLDGKYGFNPTGERYNKYGYGPFKTRNPPDKLVPGAKGRLWNMPPHPAGKLTVVPQSQGPIDWTGVPQEMREAYERAMKGKDNEGTTVQVGSDVSEWDAFFAAANEANL